MQESPSESGVAHSELTGPEVNKISSHLLNVIKPFTAMPLYWDITCWASHFSLKNLIFNLLHSKLRRTGEKLTVAVCFNSFKV
jgi:hypothetical protein